jgi:hypothetical protein
MWCVPTGCSPWWLIKVTAGKILTEALAETGSLDVLTSEMSR